MKINMGPPALTAEPATRVTWDLMAMGPSTYLHFMHDELRDAPFTGGTAGAFWDSNLSKLKTRLETGRKLALSFEEARENEKTGPALERPRTTNPLAYLRQVALVVEDLKKVRPWYESALQLPLGGFSLDWITFQMATPPIQIQEFKPGKTKPGQIVLSFYVGDPDGLFARLKEQGVQFDQPLTDLGRVKEFVFVSPEGFRFQIQGPSRPSATRPSETQPSATRPASN
jgi:hypothetical protein